MQVVQQADLHTEHGSGDSRAGQGRLHWLAGRMLGDAWMMLDAPTAYMQGRLQVKYLATPALTSRVFFVPYNTIDLPRT